MSLADGEGFRRLQDSPYPSTENRGFVEDEAPFEADVLRNATPDPEQPLSEHAQHLYYVRGLEDLDSLQLLDLSPLATWKLSSYKQGHGLAQLRDDSPETYWQSDGSADNNMEPQQNLDAVHLNNPHSVTLQFLKRVSLERISIFTNYLLDELYTPLKLKIMAGSSNWDLTEVCMVTLDKPIGWSHIIFKGVRGDGLLKCFLVKIIILANHQDGKDSHIRSLRCLGKKSGALATNLLPQAQVLSLDREISPEPIGMKLFDSTLDELPDEEQVMSVANERILNNVNEMLGFNTGFDSFELKSISSIR